MRLFTSYLNCSRRSTRAPEESQKLFGSAPVDFDLSAALLPAQVVSFLVHFMLNLHRLARVALHVKTGEKLKPPLLTSIGSRFMRCWLT